MSKEEKHVLENLFDGLDRLFDRQSKTIDIYALVYATEKAIGDKYPSILLNEYTIPLSEICTSGEPEEQQREKALRITNTLRIKLNELLPS